MVVPTVRISEKTQFNLVSASQFSPNFRIIDGHIKQLIKSKQFTQQCKELSKIVELAKTELFSDLRPLLVEFLWSILLDSDAASSFDLDLQSNFFRLVISAILTLQSDKINTLFEQGIRNLRSFDQVDEIFTLSTSIKIGFVLHLTVEKLSVMYPTIFQDTLNSKLSAILKLFANCIRVVSNSALSKETEDGSTLSILL